MTEEQWVASAKLAVQRNDRWPLERVCVHIGDISSSKGVCPVALAFPSGKLLCIVHGKCKYMDRDISLEAASTISRCFFFFFKLSENIMDPSSRKKRRREAVQGKERKKKKRKEKKVSRDVREKGKELNRFQYFKGVYLQASKTRKKKGPNHHMSFGPDNKTNNKTATNTISPPTPLCTRKSVVGEPTH